MPIKCPRCGDNGYLEEMTVGGNTYVYARHIYWERNEEGKKVKKHVRKCYLGAKRAYKYVDGKFHQLGLSSPVTMDLSSYLNSLERLLVKLDQKVGQYKHARRQAAAILRKWAEIFERDSETPEPAEKPPE